MDTKVDQSDRLLALATFDLILSLQDTLSRELEGSLENMTVTTKGHEIATTLIDKNGSSFTSFSSFKRTLSSPLALQIMFLIWKESPLVDQEDLKALGMHKVFEDGDPLTANKLRNSIVVSDSGFNAQKSDALKRAIDRICASLEVYDLIDRHTVRENFKPIVANTRLDTLMRSVYRAPAGILAKQLGEEPQQDGD